jgi:hypothetical protein
MVRKFCPGARAPADSGRRLTTLRLPQRAAITSLIVVLALSACDAGEGWIVLRNRTDRSIVSISIEPCGAPIPGPNRLHSPILPGESESFLVRFGCYDVVVMTEDEIPGGWRIDVNASQRRIILFAEPPQAGVAAVPDYSSILELLRNTADPRVTFFCRSSANAASLTDVASNGTADPRSAVVSPLDRA